MSILVPFGIPAWVKIVNTGKLNVRASHIQHWPLLEKSHACIATYSVNCDMAHPSCLSIPSPPPSCPMTHLAITVATTNLRHIQGPASPVVRGSSSSKWQGGEAGAGVKGKSDPQWCNISLRVNFETQHFPSPLLDTLLFLAFLFYFACRLLVTAPVTRGLSSTVLTATLS